MTLERPDALVHAVMYHRVVRVHQRGQAQRARELRRVRIAARFALPTHALPLVCQSSAGPAVNGAVAPETTTETSCQGPGKFNNFETGTTLATSS